jgi:hypothetical protein
MMSPGEVIPTPASIETYLNARPRGVRWREWLRGRRYRMAQFGDRPRPLVVIAHSARDAARARELALTVEQEWVMAPAACREAYDEILFKSPGLVIVQLRRQNVCGCLGHRHVVVKEAPFAEPHEALGSSTTGELDIAFDRIATWAALPLSDTALDARIEARTRLEDFRVRQFRLRALSVLLHEINHLVFPHEPESTVRERSLAFYRDALEGYVESTAGTLSFTLDRSSTQFR